MSSCWVVSGNSYAVGSIMLSRSFSDLVVSCASLSDVCSIDSISVMSAVAIVAVGAGGFLRYPSPCPVNKYISLYVPCLHARWFAAMPVGQAITVKEYN